MRIALLLLLGCSSPAPPPVTHPPIAPAIAPSHARLLTFRQIRVGKSTAVRVTFTLGIDGTRASLVETNERGERGVTLAHLDQVQWTPVAKRTYLGPAKDGELDLASDGVQPLTLHCTTRGIDAAAAGAVPIGRADDCEDKGWDPSGTTQIEAFVCDAGSPDPDGDDLLVFGPAPGFEYVTVSEACVRQGLRIAH